MPTSPHDRPAADCLAIASARAARMTTNPGLVDAAPIPHSRATRRAATYRAARRLAGAALALCLAACGTIAPVQPWEKGVLAKPEMRFDGERLGQTFNEHVYASREGAAGGSGTSGGGCGCY